MTTKIPGRDNLKTQARALLEAGQLAEAESAWDALCKSSPEDPECWSSLGMVHLRLDQLAVAERCFAKATQLAPGVPLVHQALGVAIHRQQRPAEAIPCYQQAIELQPDYIEARYFLANALQESGDNQSAESSYRQLLEQVPEHSDALNSLGSLLSKTGRFDEAIDIMKRALILQPDHVESLKNLAEAYQVKGAYDPAIKHLTHALLLQEDFLPALFLLGVVYHQANRLEESQATFEKGRLLQPEEHRFAVNQALVLGKLHRYEDAHELLKPLIKSDIPEAAIPFFEISHHINRREEAVALLQTLLKRGGSPPGMTATLHYRMANHLEGIEDRDHAFQHYREANQAETQAFDLDGTKRQFANIIETYNRASIARMPKSDCQSDRPVFIVGMPRTGSSLLEQILASHSKIYGAGELPDIFDSSAMLSAKLANGEPFPAFADTLDKEHLNIFAQRYLDKIAAIAGPETRVTDKLPGNFVYLGLIAQLFPRSRIIHIKRNPMDTCLSCYCSQFGMSGHRYVSDLQVLGQYYVEYRKLMEHWKQVLDLPLLEVDYENLVSEQEAVSRRVVDFCELEWEPACLDFHKSERVVFTISNQQVRNRMHTGSVGRWRGFASHLDDLRKPLDDAGIDYRLPDWA